MGVGDGIYTLGPASGQLQVKTTRTGLGARAGHDLTIEVTRWNADVIVDAAQLSASSVTVEVDADSFEVREGSGGIKPLTDSDRAQIKTTIQQKVLRTGLHPTMTFRSKRIEGTAESFTVEGDLTIADVTQPVTVHGQLADRHVQGSATIVQTRWGIRPYTGFFGALKLSDEVRVEFSADLTSAA
ncbi:MAG TPA: YceI family protein [Streptosporangiaceae bacterium]|jgi:polyisoprenoid-binding protein YceI|nr:YceI family protein [Streptosporangiaceae bacterium]